MASRPEPRSTAGAQRPWVFLGHTFERVGPPIFLLHFLRWLAANEPRPVHVVSLRDGELRAAFEQVTTTVTVVPEPDPGRIPRLHHRASDAARDARYRRSLGHIGQPGLVYVNTALSVRCARLLPRDDAPRVAHVHELEVGMSLHITAADRDALRRAGTRWIAASQAVATNLSSRHEVPPARITVHHEMIDAHPAPARVGAADLLATLQIAPGEPVIGTTAVVSWRKGQDLLVRIAGLLGRHPAGAGAHFVWVGVDDRDQATRALREDVAAAGLSDRIHLVPAVEDPIDWMRAFDVFVLPAREDAFPLACLEAASVGVPIVTFDNGGMVEFVESDAGVIVPYPDIEAFAATLGDLLADRDRLRTLGATAQAKVQARHHVGNRAPALFADLRRWERS